MSFIVYSRGEIIINSKFMPDLSYEAVHAFWHEYDHRILYKVVTSIEATETWVASNDEIEQLIIDLGDVLDSAQAVPGLTQATFINLLTSISFSQSLRVMQFIETKTPGFVSGLLSWAEDQQKNKKSNIDVDNFLRRNIIFERLQLLGRIFSQDRINLITKAQEIQND